MLNIIAFVDKEDQENTDPKMIKFLENAKTQRIALVKQKKTKFNKSFVKFDTFIALVEENV